VRPRATKVKKTIGRWRWEGRSRPTTRMGRECRFQEKRRKVLRDGPFSVHRRFVIEALRALRGYCRECKAEPLTRQVVLYARPRPAFTQTTTPTQQPLTAPTLTHQPARYSRCVIMSPCALADTLPCCVRCRYVEADIRSRSRRPHAQAHPKQEAQEEGHLLDLGPRRDVWGRGFFKCVDRPRKARNKRDEEASGCV
jgi:hypothetical protein